MKTFYTDYPMTSGQPKGMVPIELLAYDRNKYVTVSYQGVNHSIKAGYVYADEQGKGVGYRDICALPRVPGEPMPTCLQIHRELLDKGDKVSYAVVTYGPTGRPDSSREYKSFDEALARVLAAIHHHGDALELSVTRKTHSRNSMSFGTIFEVNGLELYECMSRGASRQFSPLPRRRYQTLMRALLRQKSLKAR